MIISPKLATNLNEEPGEILLCGIYEDHERNPSKQFQELESSIQQAFSDIFSRGDFKGKIGDSTILYTKDEIAIPRILFLGMGPKEGLDLEKIRRISSVGLKKVKSLNLESFHTILFGVDREDLTISEIVEAMVESFLLSDYKLTDFITEKKDEIKRIDQITLLHEAQKNIISKAIKTAKIIADSTNLARNLGNLPANVATPTKLAETAEELASQSPDLKCEIYSQQELEQMKFGSFLSVARGSNEPCKFIVLEYTPKKPSKETVVLIGKGITFDSGGISLKTSSNMWEMKSDMCGAATVIATLGAVAQLKLPIKVVGLAPATENLPGGIKPNKPGDIVTSLSGKTIEILNTDAEGRLILVDALTHAADYKPTIVIDVATLTGASIVALGTHASGVFSDDDELVTELIQAGNQTHERLWRLPLWEEYEKAMEGEIADVKNLGTRKGGASEAAGFLKHFTTKDYKWAHIDIAPTAMTEKESYYIPKGTTGVGVRLFIRFLRNKY